MSLVVVNWVMRPNDPETIELSECTRGDHAYQVVYLPTGVPCPDHDPEEWKRWRDNSVRITPVYTNDDYSDVGYWADGVGNAFRIDGRMMRRMRSAASTRSQLADELGALKTENSELLQENARLRRKLEALERKR